MTDQRIEKAAIAVEVAVIRWETGNDQEFARYGRMSEVVADVLEKHFGQSGPKQQEESAWLIENSVDRGMWWDGRGFTNDSLRAVRFSRREDAEEVIGFAVMTGDESDPIPTEHLWLDAPAPSAPEPASEPMCRCGHPKAMHRSATTQNSVPVIFCNGCAALVKGGRSESDYDHCAHEFVAPADQQEPGMSRCLYRKSLGTVCCLLDDPNHSGEHQFAITEKDAQIAALTRERDGLRTERHAEIESGNRANERAARIASAAREYMEHMWNSQHRASLTGCPDCKELRQALLDAMEKK